MKKLDIVKKLDGVLPENWRITETDTKSGLVKIVCPMCERYGKEFDDTIARIERSLNAEYDGGGALIGDVKYDNYFYVRKEQKKTNKTKKGK